MRGFCNTHSYFHMKMNANSSSIFLKLEMSLPFGSVQIEPIMVLAAGFWEEVPAPLFYLPGLYCDIN